MANCSTVDRRPSTVDHTQRPAWCTARWATGCDAARRAIRLRQLRSWILWTIPVTQRNLASSAFSPPNPHHLSPPLCCDLLEYLYSVHGCDACRISQYGRTAAVIMHWRRQLWGTGHVPLHFQQFFSSLKLHKALSVISRNILQCDCSSSCSIVVST